MIKINLNWNNNDKCDYDTINNCVYITIWLKLNLLVITPFMSNNHIESEIMGLILKCKVPVVSKMNYTATKGTQLVLEFWSLMKFGNLKTNCIVLEYTCGYCNYTHTRMVLYQ